MPTIKAEALTQFARHLFEAGGTASETAAFVADTLVASNLAGHDSHGVIRVIQYLNLIETQGLSPNIDPVIASETPTVTMVDAQYSFGQVAARFAMQITIDKAKQHNMASAGIFNCNHIGRLTDWIQMATDHGMIGMAFCNGGTIGGLVTPYGGASRFLGTNPIGVAVPMKDRPPFIMDFATSVVAEGKLRVARNKGEPVPDGWILDQEGQPTTDPEDFYAGGVLLPAAGYKGFGLSMLNELMGGVLTGRGNSGLPNYRTGNGVVFVVLDIEAFRPLKAFLDHTETLADHIKAIPPGPDFDEVFIPGEPEQRSAEKRIAEGIPVDEGTWGQLVAAGEKLGVPVPSI